MYQLSTCFICADERKTKEPEVMTPVLLFACTEDLKRLWEAATSAGFIVYSLLGGWMNWNTYSMIIDTEKPSEGGNTSVVRGELSYLAPLGSENISAPYFKQCFFQGGGYYPPDWVKHHTSQSQDRNNKYFILYIEFCINNKI